MQGLRTGGDSGEQTTPVQQAAGAHTLLGSHAAAGGTVPGQLAGSWPAHSSSLYNPHQEPDQDASRDTTHDWQQAGEPDEAGGSRGGWGGASGMLMGGGVAAGGMRRPVSTSGALAGQQQQTPVTRLKNGLEPITQVSCTWICLRCVQCVGVSLVDRVHALVAQRPHLPSCFTTLPSPPSAVSSPCIALSYPP
jgi:hypothetical protein